MIDPLNVRRFADSNLHGAFSVEEIAEAIRLNEQRFAVGYPRPHRAWAHNGGAVVAQRFYCQIHGAGYHLIAVDYTKNGHGEQALLSEKRCLANQRLYAQNLNKIGHFYPYCRKITPFTDSWIAPHVSVRRPK